MRLRPYLPDRREFVSELMDIYGAKPEPGSDDALFDFLQTIYNAGWLDGIRQKRAETRL